MVYSAHSFPTLKNNRTVSWPRPMVLLLSQGSSFRVAQGVMEKERAVIPDVNHNVRIASNSLASSIQSLSPNWAKSFLQLCL